MVPKLALLILLASAGAACADLDLTPTLVSTTLDKAPVSHIAFHDGATEIAYQPPNGWICDGSANAASLSIPGYSAARAFIYSAPKLRVPALDDKAEALFIQKPALLGLPKGAKDIVITAATVNPLIIDSHPTLELQLTYSFFGQKCARSLILCDRKGAEVSFVLDCLAPDFAKLSPKFRRSLYTFENL
jgi:hypothetical protein